MNRTFGNVYEDEERARAYATLQFPGTYYLAFRDLPALIRCYNHGHRALDFGCGTGRSTRFLGNLGLEVIGVDISQAMLDQARALDPSGEYYLVRGSIVGEFAPGRFDVILAAFTFDNIPTDEAKADALRGLRTLLAPDGALFLLVSSPAIYVNEWASFSTRDFPENRHARDGDRVRIVMLDVSDRRPVEDVVCTDARYRRLFESAGLGVLDVQSPLATGKEATRWVSETSTAPWTIYVLSRLPGDEASIFFKAPVIWCKRAAGARSSMKLLLVRPRASVSSIRACPWAWKVNSNSYWSDQAGLLPRGKDRPGQLASKKQELFIT